MQLGVCNASKSEQVKVDHMLDVVTKDNNNGRSALDKFRFRIFERNLEVEEQRELSQLPEDQYKVHIISRDWLQCWGHWLHGKHDHSKSHTVQCSKSKTQIQIGGVPPTAIDQNILVDKNGKLRVPEKSLDGWSLGFIGPRLWNHLKDAWGVNGPELTEGKFYHHHICVLLANAQFKYILNFR